MHRRDADSRSCIVENYGIEPFRIHVADAVLEDLRLRLRNTRWSYQVEGASWKAGTDLDYLKELVAYCLKA